MALSNRFSALSAHERELHEVDTTRDEMVPEATDVCWSDLDSSTYSHEPKTKPLSHSRKSKRGPRCAKHGGGLAPASRSELAGGAEVNFLTSDSSYAQELNNLEQSGWVEIKGEKTDSGAADSVAPPSVLSTNDLQEHSMTYQMVDVTRSFEVHFKNLRQRYQSTLGWHRWARSV